MEQFHHPYAKRTNSQSCFEKGKHLIPGGVSSPGRAFSEVGGVPLVVKQGEGKYLIDIDENRYIDFICGLGPVILGHGNSEVAKVVNEQFANGSVYGAPTEIEYELAKIIISSSDFIEQVRFTCSGSEATMTALRIARAATGKSGFLKFRGGYHGHSDVLISKGEKEHMKPKAGAQVKNGIDPAMEYNTFIADFNDLDAVTKILNENYESIGAIIIEPVPSNIGVIPPNTKFLKALRSLADKHQIILIFDEVVSGFRHRFGPVADELGVRPDLITFGKIIGGGLPVGAFGGSAELMNLLIEQGGVFQGGTFSSSPLVMAAGVAQLNLLKNQDVLTKTNALASKLCEIIKENFQERSLPYSAQSYGSLVTPILVENKSSLNCYSDVEMQDKELFSLVFNELLFAGIAIPPTIEEPIFISWCHNLEDIKLLASKFVQSVENVINNQRCKYTTQGEINAD